MMKCRAGWLLVMCLFGTARQALASSINQNTSWTIERPGATATYRVTAYGDSIYAGYTGALFEVAQRAAPFVLGEYAATAWNANVEVVRRTKSGGVSAEIYYEKVLGERSYMEDAKTRVVMIEMCGNDYLEARSAFAEQTGACDLSELDSALESCTENMERSMEVVRDSTSTAVLRTIATLYYPGYDAEDEQTTCTSNGQTQNLQDTFLPYLARGNWRACDLAQQYGFTCIDGFAELMGADYDSNGDGVIDSTALRWASGETEDAYVTRITTTLRSTVRDANTHLVSASTSFDYLQSDDIHPTFLGNDIIYTGDDGASSATYEDGQITDGKNPRWNAFGHERLGWANTVVLAEATGEAPSSVSGEPVDDATAAEDTEDGGCASAGSAGLTATIVALGVMARRRRSGRAQPSRTDATCRPSVVANA